MPADKGSGSSSSSSDSGRASKRRRTSKWEDGTAGLAAAAAAGPGPTSFSRHAVQTADAASFHSSMSRPGPHPGMRGMQDNPRVYVGNLDPVVSEKELMQIFHPFGMITGIDMPKEGNPPVRKGFAFVEFMDQKMADLAIQSLQDFFINGRKLRVGQPTATKRANAAPPVTPQMLHAMSTLPGTTASDPLAAMTALERRRITVTNIPQDTQQATIQTIFQTFGMLTKVEGGGGLFVVEYASEASTAQAFQALQGFRIGGVALQLARGTQTPHAGSPVSSPTAMPALPPPKPAAKLPDRIKILLLENMVGPGEADDELEGEVKEECEEKFGKVLEVKVYEMGKAKNVRVFVKFASAEAGGKAGVAMQGRWFGKRQVRASSYNEEAYNFGNLDQL
mmetsp:Transcript_2195/g.4665  ORF Transcript_2195/g.4665 Transcript_2195/m.4665 type:complete len:393 (+) Transcript_2195:164-1342(+)